MHDRGWLPKLGLKGILRLTIFKDIFVASGCGVGGGSLGYANTLYRARRASYSDRQWADLGDWEPELGPRYDEAERMLGVTTYDEDSEADLLLKADAQERGFGETYAKTRVRVFLGEPDTTVPDPYFGGEGPDRAGCIRCGSCMVGAAITPRTRWSRTTSTSPNVGASRSCRSAPWSTSARGSLPRVSDRLGHLVRTNSEPILTVIAPDDARDFIRAVAITSSIYPDPDTHIEPVTYGRGADSQSLLFFLMTEAGTRRNQPVQLALNMLRHPRLALGAMRVRAWSRRTVILLVMQTLDNAIRVRVKRRWPNGNVVLITEQDPENPNPDKIPAAYRAAEWMQDKLGGSAQAVFTEAIFSIPMIAHILGGAGRRPWDRRGRRPPPSVRLPESAGL